jgi:hypothetical protein
MAGEGKRVTFHGAFLRKRDAKRRESERFGSYVLKIKVRGQTRWAVVREK